MSNRQRRKMEQATNRQTVYRVLTMGAMKKGTLSAITRVAGKQLSSALDAMVRVGVVCQEGDCFSLRV